MQEINLYQPVFRKRRIVFSAIAILQIVAVIFVGLLVVSGFEKYRVNAMENELQALEQRRNSMLSHLTELTTALPERSEDKQLHEQLRRVLGEQQRKLQAVRLLSQGDLGSTGGFSAHLAGLAENTVDGLWLTQITVNRPANSVAMSGATHDEELLPKFLGKLSNTDAFSGTEFRHVELRRDKEDPRRLTFRLNTRVEIDAEASLPVIQMPGLSVTTSEVPMP